MMIHLTLRKVAMVPVMVLVFGKAVKADPQYNLTGLGQLPERRSSIAEAINDRGEVVGHSDGSAFLWDRTNGMIVLEGLKPTNFLSDVCHDINNLGQVVGDSFNEITQGDLVSGTFDAALWDAEGEVTRLLPADVRQAAGITGWSEAHGINIQGTVVGLFRKGGETITAFIWDPEGGFRELEPPLGDEGGAATGINDHGQVVGNSFRFGSALSFIWDPENGYKRLGALPGMSQSAATAVNNAGQVVGHSHKNLSVRRAFLWGPSSGLKDLGTLPGFDDSSATAINDRGEVVGESKNTDDPLTQTAVLWDEDGNIHDLNDSIDPDSGWTLTVAHDINTHGQIVGYGTNPDGLLEAFLLTPAPGGLSTAVELAVAHYQGGFAERDLETGSSIYEQMAERYTEGPLPVTIDFDGRTPQVFLEEVLADWYESGEGEWANPHDPETALAHYIRAQTLLGQNALVEAAQSSYLREDPSGGAGESTPQNDFVPGPVLTDVDNALVELRKVLRYVPEVERLKARDDAEGLSGEGSGIRDLVRLHEVLIDLTLFTFDLYHLEALVGGPESETFRELMAFARQSLQDVNLSVVVLSQVLTEGEFADNGVRYLRLKSTELSAAMERLSENVLDSAALRGDYTGEVMTRFNYVPNPSRPVRTYFDTAKNQVQSAIGDWQSAEVLKRQYDIDRTAMRSELSKLRTTFVDQIRLLTGIDPEGSVRYRDEGGRVLGNDLAVQNYLNDVYTFGAGEFAIQRSRIEQARSRLLGAIQVVENLTRKIEIEEKRQKEVATVIRDNLDELRALDVARAQATACTESFKERDPCDSGFFCFCGCIDTGEKFFDEQTGISCNPGAEDAANLSADRRDLEAEQNIEIQGINSAAQVEKLVLDQAVAGHNVDAVAEELRAAELTLEQLSVKLYLLIQQYQQASEDFADAYFNNPAYRIARDDAVTRADQSLKWAQMQCYRFARRLEYAWSDNFTNDSLLAGHPEWEPFARATSVFDTINPHQCRDFLDALAEWDHQLRNSRNNHQETPAFERRLSLRRHIFGLDDYSNDSEILPIEVLRRNQAEFQNIVESQRLTAPVAGFEVSDPENPPLLITFPLNLLSPPPHVAAYFQTGSQWNQKVTGFDFNLVGSGDLLRSSGGRLATLHLLQRGIAAVRQHGDNGVRAIVFDADPWKDRNAPFGRPNASTYQNVTINAVDRATNYQSAAGDPLYNRAVSSTEWTLFLDPAISDQGQFSLTLDLTKLTDIEMLISYSHGAPPDWR